MNKQPQRNEEVFGVISRLFAEKGYLETTMREIAKELGMKPASLYNYFDGLMDLYDALFQQGMILFNEHLQAHIQEASTWQEQVRRAMEAYLTFAIQHPELYQLCFERPVPGFEPSAASMQVSQETLQASYARVAAIQDQLDTDLPATQVTDLLIALMHGLTAQHMANEPHLPLGQGRFGSLIPEIISILNKAWSKK